MAASHHEGRRLQHHFVDMEQQREAGTLGMWLFLVTEIMFFGGMFLAYALYRSKYPLEFALLRGIAQAQSQAPALIEVPIRLAEYRGRGNSTSK